MQELEEKSREEKSNIQDPAAAFVARLVTGLVGYMHSLTKGLKQMSL